MTVAGRTAFVTGATGFIGRELTKQLAARGWRVFGLARSAETARTLQLDGVTVVKGDLLEPGQWQDEAATHWVFHIPPLNLAGPVGLPWRRNRTAYPRSLMDKHVLEAVTSGPTRRIVYVADASCCGPTGSNPITEDGCAKLETAEDYVAAGAPIVTALPGCVYGNGSWFRQQIIEPIMSGRRVVQFGTTGPWVSPIHVHDCARALIHLAEHGEVGNRYFLANGEPVRINELSRAFARAVSRPHRVWHMPALAAQFIRRRPFADYIQRNAAFSSIRLRGIGFHFHYPTLEDGIEQVVGALHANVSSR
jgi:nucleoside-diphosphate-sugar epimerase